MTITEAFLEGKVAGEGSKPLHIVTAISNIFVFSNVVYKIYKTDSEFFNKNFNDLSDKTKRFDFTRKDFEWNHRISPQIYTELKGAKLENEMLALGEPTDEAEELVMVMNKIDMSNQVIKKLVDNKIKVEDCHQIGKQFGDIIIKQPKIELGFTAYEDFQTRYIDEIAWITSVKEVPQDEATKYLLFVKESIEKHKDTLDQQGQMGLCLDVHADNAVYENGKFLPIDTYAPKEAWLYGFKNINIYRVATDFYVFMGKKAFDEVIRGYEEATGEKLPRDWDKFMVIYCEIIMWPYQYMLAEKETWRVEVAKKHQEFLREIFTQ